MIRTYGLVMSMSRDWESSYGRDWAWWTFMALVTDEISYRRRMEKIALVSYEPVLCTTARGVVVYTMNADRIHLHLIVPVRLGDELSILEDTLTTLTSMHGDSVIDFTPLKKNVKGLNGSCRRKLRVVPSRAYVQSVRISEDREHIVCGTRSCAVLAVVDSVRDVRPDWLPLTRLSPDDDGPYWFRFPCGVIAAFHNSIADAPPKDTLPFPAAPKADLDLSTVIVQEELRCYIRAINPGTVEDTLAVLALHWIPGWWRAWCVRSCVLQLGIRDDLVVEIGHSPFPDEVLKQCQTIVDMVNVSRVMRSVKPGDSAGEDLVGAIERCDDQEAWRTWLYKSEFVYACVDAVSPSTLRKMIDRVHTFLGVAARLLQSRTGRWSRTDLETATLLCSAAARDDGARQLYAEQCLACVRTEFARVRAVADDVVRDLLAADDDARRGVPPPKKSAKVAVAAPLPSPPPPTVAKVCRGVSSASEARDPTVATHAALVDRMRRAFGLDVKLIGSGVFRDDGDVDVAVAVPGAASLEEAYTAVIDATGWTRKYERVDGDHVAVLAGIFEGKDVDAQVWRGVAGCRAEQETRRAIELSRRVRDEVDDATKTALRHLHRWSESAGCKGHCVGRMSGIGITCVALAINRQRNAIDSSVRWLLDELRVLVSRQFPRVSIDDDDDDDIDGGARCRPTVPLHVVADGRNVVSRMTACTTRHFLDTIAYSIAMPGATLFDRGVHARWRREHMVCGGIVVPRSGRSVPATLHKAIASLDGHPLIDTVFVDYDDAASELRVLCTLRPDADACRYGFRADDVVSDADAAPGHVVVVRGKNRYPLAVSAPRVGALASHRDASRVSDVVDTPAGCVPNAPFLTVDVCSRFDARYWTHVCR